MSYPPQTPNFGLPPEPETDLDTLDDLDAALASATETALAKLDQARRYDRELRKLRDGLNFACSFALQGGLGHDGRTMKPLPDGVDCEELTVDTKSDGPWISLQGRPRGTQRIAQYRLPRAVVIEPEVADLQRQRLEAIFLGTTPPEPITYAMSARSYRRLQELAAQATAWDGLVVRAAIAADAAGRVEVEGPDPESGRAWVRSLSEEAREHAIRWDGLDEEVATIIVNDDLFGTIPWGTLLLFDPESPLYRRFAALQVRGDTLPAPHLAKRKADAEHFVASRAAVKWAREAVERARQDRVRPGWPDKVSVTIDAAGAPVVDLPVKDAVRGRAEPVRLVVDVKVDDECWVLEYSDGYREATDVLYHPTRLKAGRSATLGGFLHELLSGAHPARDTSPRPTGPLQGTGALQRIADSVNKD